MCLLQDFSVVPLHYCVIVFDFSGFGKDDNDYIKIPSDFTDGMPPDWMLPDWMQRDWMARDLKVRLRHAFFEAFAGAGFARRKDQDKYKLLPCRNGTFVNSSATDPSKLVCLECPPGSYNNLTMNQCYVTK